MWKVLHSLSFAPPSRIRARKQQVIEFLECLKDVLPCVYCRNSYTVFLSELPDISGVIDNGQLDRWMFDLHSKVNSKLGVPDPEFERVKKRFAIRAVQWCPADVWDLIALFGLNYTSQKSDVYRTWWDTLIPVLQVAGAPSRMIELLSSVECPCVDGAFVATSHVLSTAYSGGERSVRRYDLAKATACRNGTCK